MRFEDVMKQLEHFGSARNRAVYARHGARGPMFGVSFATLDILRKDIGTDHGLAEKLWESGNIDARMLATMVADAARVDGKQLEKWVHDIDYYVLADAFVKNLVSKTRFVRAKLRRWTKSDNEWIGRAGWQLCARLAVDDRTLPDAFFEPFLRTIQSRIDASKNRAREAMNNALIAIGLRSSMLEIEALGVAQAIGPVEIDHGQTSCQTPDAAQYILMARGRTKKGPAWHFAGRARKGGGG